MQRFSSWNLRSQEQPHWRNAISSFKIRSYRRIDTWWVNSAEGGAMPYTRNSTDSPSTSGRSPESLDAKDPENLFGRGEMGISFAEFPVPVAMAKRKR